MFDRFTKMYANRDRLQRLKLKMNPSELNGNKFCSQSGFCCFKRPAVPSPDEIKQLAKHFKLTPNEFINKYCAIDYAEGEYYPKLLGSKQLDIKGQFIPADRTFDEGACIMLSKQKEDGKYNCTINEVKPEACRYFECWVDKPNDPNFVWPYELWEGNQLKYKFDIDGKKLNNDW